MSEKVLGNVPSETLASNQKSQGSSKIVSAGGLSGTSGSNSTSTDSERTYRVDSQDSQISDTETGGDRHWPRQNSVRDVKKKITERSWLLTRYKKNILLVVTTRMGYSLPRTRTW